MWLGIYEHQKKTEIKKTNGKPACFYFLYAALVFFSFFLEKNIFRSSGRHSWIPGHNGHFDINGHNNQNNRYVKDYVKNKQETA